MVSDEREGTSSLEQRIQNMNTSTGGGLSPVDAQTAVRDALGSSSSAYTFAREFNKEITSDE